eukprot:1178407-Prorocentrum_minimum.AAC.2
MEMCVDETTCSTTGTCAVSGFATNEQECAEGCRQFAAVAPTASTAGSSVAGAEWSCTWAGNA